VLEKAKNCLPAYPEIHQALSDLKILSQSVSGLVDSFACDLAELRGYNYHSGVVFSIYLPGVSHVVAKGGRYDEVGLAFGRARPATGFSMDLRILCGALALPAARPAILAPWSEDAGLKEKVESLRNHGEVVIVDLPGHDACRGELGCDRQLVLRDNEWQVTAI